MKSIFILGVFLLLLVMMLLASCKPEARCLSQINFYVDSAKCPQRMESNKAYVFGDVTGCIRPVSELIHERDSLRKLVKRYKCEFETIQEAREFLDSRDSICCDFVIVRSIELEGDTAKWVPGPDSLEDDNGAYLLRVDVYRCIHCGESIYQQANHGAWVHNTFSDGGYISCLDHKEKKFVPHRKSKLAEPTPEVYEYFRDHTFDNSDTWERIVIHEPIQLPLKKDTLSHVILVIAKDFKGSSIYKFDRDSLIVFPGPIVIENAERLSLFQ